jgi:hypothetical protein
VKKTLSKRGNVTLHSKFTTRSPVDAYTVQRFLCQDLLQHCYRRSVSHIKTSLKLSGCSKIDAVHVSLLVGVSGIPPPLNRTVTCCLTSISQSRRNRDAEVRLVLRPISGTDGVVCIDRPGHERTPNGLLRLEVHNRNVCVSCVMCHKVYMDWDNGSRGINLDVGRVVFELVSATEVKVTSSRVVIGIDLLDGIFERSSLISG